MKMCKRHMERVIYDGTENYPTACRWCARCGAIYHPKRKKDGGFSKRLTWQLPSGSNPRIKECGTYSLTVRVKKP